MTIDAEEFEIDEARDSLYALPLQMLPLETPGLKKATLDQNAHMQTMLELFKEKGAGSGQVDPSKLDTIFTSFKEEVQRDQTLISTVATLPSFDVFTLRVGLRRLNVSVNDNKYLSLSDATRERLNSYMHEFTKPLILQVYGGEQASVQNISDLMGMFRQPDKTQALENLKRMSDRLQVELPEIPAFLEDYGDIFLSVAYFRSHLDETNADLDGFMTWSQGIEENQQLAGDQDLMRSCKIAEATLQKVSVTLDQRLKNFQDCFAHFWDDINKRSFTEIKDLVTTNHENLGGMLCGLNVKMRLWRDRFPTEQGSPNARADFILTEIIPGLQPIKALSETNPAGK